MQNNTWITFGLGIICLSFIGRVLFTKFIMPIPGTAVRFGRFWSETSARFLFLRVLNTFFYIVGAVATAVGVAFAISNVTSPDPPPPPPASIVFQSPPDETLDSVVILQLVNNERQKQGLSRLVSDPRLVAVAEARAKEMIDKQYYAHINQEGKYFYDLFPSYGFKSDYSCENLDTEFTTNEQQYITDWITSTKGHKECLLNPKATVAGYVAVLFGETSNGKIYLVVGIHSSPIKPLP